MDPLSLMAAQHSAQGTAAMSSGRHADAIAKFRAALCLDQTNLEALVNLGVALNQMGRREESVPYFQRATRQATRNPNIWHNLAIPLSRLGRWDEAEAALRTALRLNPSHPRATVLLGYALLHRGELDEAESLCHRATGDASVSGIAHTHLAMIEESRGRYDEAMAHAEQALSRLGGSPDAANAQTVRSTLRLRAGDYRGGWPGLQFVRSLPNWPQQRHDDKPEWDGSDPAGKTILVWAEQGLGDAIQFCRYIPLLTDRGANVTFECPAPLSRLARPLWHGIGLHDLHVPMFKLPMIFGTTIQTVPSAVPYLHPDPQAVSGWRDKLSRSTFKVAVAWRGNPRHANDRNRSMPLAMLAPLAAVPGMELFALPKCDGAGELDGCPFPVTRLAGEDDWDLADSAAVLSAMDMVVTVDTALAHLAGAIGRSVWALLPYVPDWRWMLKRDDSPWYPTARLYRQDSSGEWASVVDRVASDIRIASKRA